MVAIELLLFCSFATRAAGASVFRSKFDDSHSHHAGSHHLDNGKKWNAFHEVAAAFRSKLGDSRSHHLDNSKKWNALHEVVGPDGVLMLYVERAGRKEYKALNDVGIYPTLVSAVDYKIATPAELREGGLTPNDHDERCFNGRGANNKPVLQAISASHLKAIRMAKDRDYEWTAILEDDASPIKFDENFDKNFREVWSKVPNETGFVRLSWCPLVGEHLLEKHVYYGYDNLRLIEYQTDKRDGSFATGGCATAYMVRRSFLPRILSIFPCCYPADTCLDFDLFLSPASCRGKNATTQCWAQKHMMSLEVIGSETMTKGWQFVAQHGILAQDNRVDISIREAKKLKK